MEIRVALRIEDEPGGRADELGGLAAAVERDPGIDLLWIARAAPAEAPLLQACAAAAACTSRLGIVAAGLGLPCHHPIRIAEDLATLDGLAAGRLEVLFQPGSGCSGRGEREVALLREAWSGVPLGPRTDADSFAGLEVHPKPARPGGPLLWIEAEQDAPELTARLAAQLGAGLASADPGPVRFYLHAWQAAARDPAEARVALPASVSLAVGRLRPDGAVPESAAPGVDPSEARAELASHARTLGDGFRGELVGIFDPGDSGMTL
jgi:alkanesulfonate monooxygenase SsuD/methylene tetrahydromethanopterin reductase-like flavin-dependent oxidoreductase (luciferase family)